MGRMAKLDPRSDPLSEPPRGNDDFSVDRVVVANSAAVAAIARDAQVVEDAEEPTTTARVLPGKITSRDPRFERLEALLDANDWKAIGKELGTVEIGTLPPNLGLVAALARSENKKEGDPDAVGIAIRCMAGLLDVEEGSPIARVLARRLLRKNPASLRQRPAPPARTSMFIVLATLVVGGAVGWLASIGSWRGIFRLFHLH